MGAVGRKFT